MEKEIFISYTTSDKAVADSLVVYLESMGYSCFIAPRDIDPGKAYAANLMSAISNCKFMLGNIFLKESNEPGSRVSLFEWFCFCQVTQCFLCHDHF